MFKIKKLILLLVVSLVIVLSGCGEYNDLQYTEPPQDDWPFTVKYAFCSKNGNYSEPYCVEFWTEYDLNEGKDLEHYYTQEEVDELLEEVLRNDLYETTEFRHYMDNAFVEFYIELGLELEEDYVLLTENQYQDLLQRIEELYKTLKIVAWESDITDIVYGEFVEFNYYGDCEMICRTYAVIEVDGELIDTVLYPEHTYIVGNEYVVVTQNGVTYSIPLEAN